ncbi:MAG: PrsW family intramembrane metalloprotease [Candidatus Obscuribacterales bacterium]|nr:PrsW family intramembrane metalloprotease [Candidatus Obscuribacterales bacterium]
MLLVFVALAPTLFWLLIFWAAEKPGHREKAGPMARCFLFGMISPVFVSLVYMLPSAIFQCGSLSELLKQAPLVIMAALILIVGPTEELMKYFATRLAIYKEPTFDESSDGIVFAASAALGFAFSEHLLYFFHTIPTMLSVNPPPPEILKLNIDPLLFCSVVRALSPPMHPLLAVFWGAALGRKLCIPGTSRYAVFFGLATASIMHGLLDSSILLASRFNWSLVIFLLLNIYLIVNAVRSYKQLASSQAPVPVSMPLAKKFQWRYALLALIITAITEGLGYLIFQSLGGDIAAFTKSGFDPGQIVPGLIWMAVSIIGLFLAGLITGILSPDRTVKEATLGILVASVICNLLEYPSQGFAEQLTSALFCLLIGSLGAYLGEALQPRKNI